MRKYFSYSLLYVLAAYFLLTAVYIFFFPQTFYNQTPGLSAMGPFNSHLIRDVSFAFLVSGSALFYGVQIHSNRHCDRP